jgi:hypothetical protein
MGLMYVLWRRGDRIDQMKKQEGKNRTNSPRILNLGLPLDRFGANLIRFAGVARRRDQEVGEEGGNRLAVAG